MRQVRDSFLHLLADNLPAYTIWNIRRDVNNPEQERVHEEAVNVQFIDDNPSVHIGNMVVALDVVSADELTAVDMMQAVWTLLSSSAYTPLLDYSTTPATPQGSNLFWNQNNIRFRPVWDQLYCRFTSTVTLRVHTY